MAKLSRKAELQVENLVDFYVASSRIEALDRFIDAVAAALSALDSDRPPSMRPFPSVYVELSDAGTRWFKRHRYWFSAEFISGEWVIENVYFDTADIPGRFLPSPKGS